MRCEERRMPVVIEAVLQVGTEVTRYVRAGEGETVLLVSDRPCEEVALSPTFLEMAERRRVIAATPPAGSDIEWLRDLIDGLGLESPELIGDRNVAPLLVRFAETHPERVA